MLQNDLYNLNWWMMSKQRGILTRKHEVLKILDPMIWTWMIYVIKNNLNLMESVWWLTQGIYLCNLLGLFHNLQFNLAEIYLMAKDHHFFNMDLFDVHDSVMSCWRDLTMFNAKNI